MTLTSLFIHLFNMSITATWIALAVILLRLVLKRTRVPKALLCILWVLVAARLILPFSVESVLSLVPSRETVPPTILLDDNPAIHSGIPVVNNTFNPIISDHLSPDPWESVNPMQVIWTVASWVWIVGMILMAVYATASYLRLRRQVRVSLETAPNVMLCDHIDTPFILGIIRPHIYLPSALSESTAPSVLAHERAHLARRDHLWKPLGFLILTVYWFNPILWVAYILLCRDIELACDERVVKNMTAAEKKDYSEALLTCSMPRHVISISACPLAFGEVGVKERVKSVLHYKKPLFWVVILALVASVIVGVCFLTDPISKVHESQEPRVSVWNLADESFERENIDDIRISYGNIFLDVDKNTVMEEFFTLMDGLALGEQYDENQLIPTTVLDADIMIILQSQQLDEYYVCFNYSLNLIWMAKNPIEYTAEGIMNPIETQACPVYQVSDTEALKAFIGKSLKETTKDYLVVHGEVTDAVIWGQKRENWGFTADVDKDGMTETFTMGYGPTSGIFTITIKGVEGDELQYSNIFHISHGDLSFVKHEDGHIQLHLVENISNREILFDVAVIDGQLALFSTDESYANDWGYLIPYWGSQGVNSDWIISPESTEG